MDAPQTEPQQPIRARGLSVGIIATVLLFLALIGLFSWLVYKAYGTHGSYYNNLMEKSQLEQQAAGEQTQ